MAVKQDYRCEKCDQYPLRLILRKVDPDSDVEMGLSWKCRRCGYLNDVIATVKGDNKMKPVASELRNKT